VKQVAADLTMLAYVAPVCVHCEHGRDRTGFVVGAYRILIQRWSIDDALAEMKAYGVRGVYEMFDAEMISILRKLV
jgi:protein tyrosine/serine phosphatase